MKPPATVAIALHTPLRRGARSLRIALVGAPGGGKSTLFRAVQATSVQSAALAGSRHAYEECAVQAGLDQARLIHLPSLRSLLNLDAADRATLKYLLWGDSPAPVARHDPEGAPAPFAPPDVILQVVDATALERHLELTLELLTLSRPLVIALNKMDEAREKGLYLSCKALARRLGVPVVPTSAARGYGIPQLFRAALDAVRAGVAPAPATSEHLRASLEPLADAMRDAEIVGAFGVAPQFLVTQLAQGDRYFMDELRQHFPAHAAEVARLCVAASARLPRPLREELHAERHHRAASFAETATRPERAGEARDLRYWLDALFLSPRWNLVGSAAVFALVLFIVFGVSAWLDSVTAARLAAWASAWQPQSTGGIVGRAVADGLIGLVGIVVPYMIPLVMLLVALEQSGVMARIAFAVDRGFHRIGLHGDVALPFLLGLGCNVPAISALARGGRGRERVAAALLITFVPCSARSALVLALAGKYLGGLAVAAIFAAAMIVIALLGKLLKTRETLAGPGVVLEIPPYARPKMRVLLRETWSRTQDIVTIVLPLLVGGSVVLALLNHFGADVYINAALTPVTAWWLGLPLVLGVPILFGVLRKELSLLMLYQAFGSFEIMQFLDPIQLLTLLLFLTFYVPCVSTFAVMLKLFGRRTALNSVLLSLGVALAAAGAARLTLLGAQALAR
ncbi:MAG: ferrous iron transporter B [Betaproteobacteria bacterium]|nr:MAG: ferrous iron transporter B [Betaproteobacteria bacterium]